MKNILKNLAGLFIALLVISSCGEKGRNGGSNPIDKRYAELDNFLRGIGTMPEPEADRKIITEKNSKTVDAGILPLDLSENSMTSYNKVTQQVDVDYISSSEDFVVLSPWPSVLWPGCLVQGASLNGVNIPNAIPLVSVRKPGRIYLHIISGSDVAKSSDEEKWYEDVEQMTASNVVQAQNRLLARYIKSGTPAQTSMKIERIYSFEDLLVNAGINVKYAQNHFNTKFGGRWSKDHSYYLVKIIQTYFTMAYDDPDGGFTGVFKPDVKPDMLRPYTGNGNPICFVSSVSYGRVYYLLCESNMDYRNMQAALDFSVGNKFNVSSKDSIDYKTIASKVKVNMLQYGGNAKDGFEGAMDLSKVKEFINKGAKFDNNNVGAPISFVVKNLYDNSIVRLSNTLKYSYDKVSYLPDNGRDEISLFIKNINFSISEKDGYTASNRGHIKLKNVRIDFYKGKNYSLNIYKGDVNNSLKCNFDMPIYEQYVINKKKAIDIISLSATVEIESSAWKSGKDRDEHKAKDVDVVVTFAKNDDGAWVVSDGDNSTTNSPFKYVVKRVSIGKLDFAIRMNYDFLLDGVVVKSNNGKLQ